MSNNNLWLSVARKGLAANRPVAPDMQPGQVTFYHATDTNVLSFYDTDSGWQDVAGTAGGINTGVVAATTQTLAAATQLTGDYNNVTTVANASDSVKLPVAVAGARVWVTNSGANAMKVFPQAATDTIDGGGAGAAATVTNVKSAVFTCLATGVWQSIGMATRAA